MLLVTPHSSGVEARQPLVSCILPTADRLGFLRQAIAYFLRQDYPSRELIIVDDGERSAENMIPSHPLVRYYRLPRRRSVGFKRNLGCQQAKGELIAHWDDDDWYARWRLGCQVRALLGTGADVCGLAIIPYYAPESERAWEYVYPSGEKPWVSGNTLCYTRALWQAQPFADQQVGEDNRFLWDGPAKQILALDKPGMCVGVIHPRNVSKKRVGDSRWLTRPAEEIHRLLGEDLPFYMSLSSRFSVFSLQPAWSGAAVNSVQTGKGASAGQGGAKRHARVSSAARSHGAHASTAVLDRRVLGGELLPGGPADGPELLGMRSDAPLISCVMPTFNRRPFIPLALEAFQGQDYPHKELIIIDDGADPIEDLVRGVPDVRYLRLPARHTIGAKRNIGYLEARGSLIAHWDDDDWYSPERLRIQSRPIRDAEADITGLKCHFMLALPQGDLWRPSDEVHQRMFVGNVHGGTLMLHRRIFERGLRYADRNIAEDAVLLQQALDRGYQMALVENASMFIYMRHGCNAWAFQAGVHVDPAGWVQVSSPAGFENRIAVRYREAALQLEPLNFHSFDGPR